jgi:ElaB/YqjD/DUF883 family membrane-anchored ribosome-binding protein
MFKKGPMMSTPKQMAEREVRRISAKAEAVLRDAANAVTDDRAKHAVGVARELFDNAPWLATTEAPIGGCLNMRYCDLYALLVIATPTEPVR